ncbi:hypothetical protein FQR65_LT20716 [Abscondita terminalis]|nr:hypothetical protein FQR65_LT20716 [Abscondita terminalis]
MDVNPTARLRRALYNLLAKDMRRQSVRREVVKFGQEKSTRENHTSIRRGGNAQTGARAQEQPWPKNQTGSVRRFEVLRQNRWEPRLPSQKRQKKEPKNQEKRLQSGPESRRAQTSLAEHGGEGGRKRREKKAESGHSPPAEEPAAPKEVKPSAVVRKLEGFRYCG